MMSNLFETIIQLNYQEYWKTQGERDSVVVKALC
jgi:hypothetical protein